MKIELKVKDKELIALLNKLEKELPAKVDNALYATAQLANQMILDRTEKGRSVTGAYFKRYSPKYAMFRAKKGRQVSPVNLNFTGKMLSSMAAFKGRGKATIKFSRAEENKKAYHNHFTNGRPFFGISKPELKRLTAFFARKVFA